MEGFKKFILQQEAIFDPDTKQSYRHKDRVKRLESIWKRYGNNAYIAFTKINKLGINPKIRAEKLTPVGIFAYPLGYLMQTLKGSIEGLPYGSGAPWIQVFTVQPGANIITFNPLPDGDAIAAQIKDATEDKRGFFSRWFTKAPEINYAALEQLIASKFLYFNELRQYASSRGLKFEPIEIVKGSGRITSDGHLLWEQTRSWSLHGSKDTSDGFGFDLSAGNFTKWNKILRELGIDGIVDNNTSTIHMLEPTQVMFLSNQKLVPIDAIPNQAKMDYAQFNKAPEKIDNKSLQEPLF